MVLHIFIDTYEKLVGGTKGEISRSLDDWLWGRKFGLIPNLERAVFTISGREKLRWTEWSGALWKEKTAEEVEEANAKAIVEEAAQGSVENPKCWIQSHIIGPLSYVDSAYFLGKCEVPENLHEYLFVLTQGLPVYLDECAKTYVNIMENEGRTPVPEDFGKNKTELREKVEKRYTSGVDDNLTDTLYLLAGMQRWNEDLCHIAEEAAGLTRTNPTPFQDLMGLDYIDFDSEYGVYSMHRIIANLLADKLSEKRRQQAAEALAKWANEGAASVPWEERTLALDAAQNLIGMSAQQAAQLVLEQESNEAVPVAKLPEELVKELAEGLLKQAKEAGSLFYGLALRKTEEAYELCESNLGECDPVTLKVQNMLAIRFRIQGDYAREKVLMEKV